MHEIRPDRCLVYAMSVWLRGKGQAISPGVSISVPDEETCGDPGLSAARLAAGRGPSAPSRETHCVLFTAASTARSFSISSWLCRASHKIQHARMTAGESQRMK
jgi:hypothetical protein